MFFQLLKNWKFISEASDRPSEVQRSSVWHPHISETLLDITGTHVYQVSPAPWVSNQLVSQICSS